MSADRKEKQRAFLAPHIEKVDGALVDGVGVLKYHRHPQATHLEAELLRHQATLEAMSAPKDAIKAAVREIEALLDLGCALWCDVLSGRWTSETDEAFAPADESAASQRYRRRVAKALANKQSHAPGFDGAGGGRARRSGD